MKVRPNRVAEEIKREIITIIRNDIKDPRVDGLVSVTDVEVTTDLSYAKIYVSKYGDDLQRDEALQGLEKASGYIRSELSKRLKLRYMPELIFKLDDSLAYGAKIETILNDINNNKGD